MLGRHRLIILITHGYNFRIIYYVYEFRFLFPGCAIMSWFFMSLAIFASPLSKMIFSPESIENMNIYEMHVDYLIFDRERYSLAFSIHFSVVYFSITCLNVSLDCLYVVAVEHSCGLLAVVWWNRLSFYNNSTFLQVFLWFFLYSYRLQTLFQNRDSEANEKGNITDKVLEKNLKDVIILHCRALR